MNFDDAYIYAETHERPGSISCFDKPNSVFHYVAEPGSSIVQEVYHSL